jgi:hypothetical protein
MVDIVASDGEPHTAVLNQGACDDPKPDRSRRLFGGWRGRRVPLSVAAAGLLRGCLLGAGGVAVGVAAGGEWGDHGEHSAGHDRAGGKDGGDGRDHKGDDGDHGRDGNRSEPSTQPTSAPATPSAPATTAPQPSSPAASPAAS